MLAYPRTFTVGGLVIAGSRTELLRCHIKLLYIRAERHHILIEFYIVAGRISEHEPCLTVIVDHNCRVDICPVRTAQRLTENVLIRTFGAVCNSNADSTSLSFICSSEVEIILSVALDALRSPCVILTAPAESSVLKNSSVIGPVLHILSGEALPAGHLVEIIFAVAVAACEDVQFIAEHDRCRIRCERCLYDRIIRKGS